MSPTKVVASVLSAVLLIAAVVLIGWRIGWWFNVQNTNRDASLQQNGVANQSAMVSEIPRKIDDVQRYTLQIENPSYTGIKHDIEQSRAYAATIACGDAAQLNSLSEVPTGAQSWIVANCSNGDLSPSSQYAVSSQPGQ